MGCLKLTYGEYRGKIIKMSKSNKDKKQNVIQISVGGVITIVVTIAIAAIGATWLVASNIMSLNKDVKAINKELNTASTERKEMYSYLYNDEGVKDQLGNISDDIAEIKKFLNSPTINASADAQECIDVSIEDNHISTSTSSISADTCIGTDSDGKAYIAKDLIGQTILLTFNQDNKEIYFMGQYNNKYHWDGYCVTNTYDAVGLLDGVCESNFDDGTRLDYESFYRSDNQEEWIYTDRDCKKDVNEGISIKYKLDYSKQKNFTITNVRVSDIIYIEDMKNCENKQILSYYDGITSDGVYNDNTGNAYLVRYNNEGFVNVFYQGCFKNGYFNDTNALEIVLDESVGINKYFVYQGKFSNGKRLSDEGIKYVTQEEINTILKENECPDDLKWYSGK